MIDLPEPPERLSVDPAYPGFREDALDLGAGVVITLDGDEQRFVVAYDVPASSVTRVCLDAAGRILADGDEMKLETVSGRVVVERRCL